MQLELSKQENARLKLQATRLSQDLSAHFEEGIVRAIQSAWQTFHERQSPVSPSVQDTWRTLGRHMASLAPNQEWISFSARSDHLLDHSSTPRRPKPSTIPPKKTLR